MTNTLIIIVAAICFLVWNDIKQSRAIESIIKCPPDIVPSAAFEEMIAERINNMVSDARKMIELSQAPYTGDLYWVWRIFDDGHESRRSQCDIGALLPAQFTLKEARKEELLAKRTGRKCRLERVPESERYDREPEYLKCEGET